MACADFDGQVVRQDPDVAELANDFVCVRIQSMNGVNLGLFQFEFDLTWMAFFMDAHDRFYARYGGREDEHAESLLTKDSLVQVMRQVLKLHRVGEVQESRYEPTGEPARTPEEIPPMKRMMARRENQCIHCHDVKVAELRHRQHTSQFARDMVFTYPLPSAVGIRVDANDQSTVREVAAHSAAARAGVRVGDRIVSADGQRILTAADFARVLEALPRQARLPMKVQRGGQTRPVTLELSGDWRRGRDPSWRESLQVAGPSGGFWGQKLPADERRALAIPQDALAVRVNHVWRADAGHAGLKVNDIVLALDGHRRDMTIRQIHAYLQLHKDYGERIPIVVLRDGRDTSLSLMLPEAPEE